MKNIYPFNLQELPYSYDALSPVIGKDTLHFHHDKHMKTYVENLNKALEPHLNFHSFSLEAVLTKLNELPPQVQTAVQNNGGGVYNHQMYFSILSRQNNNSKPSEALQAAFDHDFGGVNKMFEQLKKEAISCFGSGWAYVVTNREGTLSICSTANQNVPNLCQFVPLITVDVWEHAYYLDYQNRRPDYITELFSLINWDIVSERYQERAKILSLTELQ